MVENLDHAVTDRQALITKEQTGPFDTLATCSDPSGNHDRKLIVA